ncbi:LuxR C-terminal-related transcriptional regulator [Mycobacterium talmoniae]|uniref:HTH-type transcriptional regulator n=2 Tax=Mycobacterium talmoniae TaxID=1858794 RepID=A0A2S8BFJ3_9MYCO|nr:MULTISPECIES: LuxR C-terminal-related transcriptional regulator [Mycobacterium]PQM45422.1 Putative HTH-type transcriptional regulator [Mycobacterium talmoniae]
MRIYAMMEGAMGRVTLGVGADASAGLPLETTSFVGRRRDRGKIRQLLGDARLVTLTGFGGVGKTRLALRVASGLRRVFADGVHVVSLAAVGDPALTAQTVVTVLGLQGRTQRAAVDSLADYLREREVLLVLDNCENVVDAVARLADILLSRCARLRILATSREPLRITGETIYAVLPLSVPPREASGPPSGLHAFEAVGLFIDRARAVHPDFELSDVNSAAVAKICSKLEGIPLAIELAAVRLRTMSPAELADNLTGRWAILTRGSRTAPDRQRTMAACIEWSYELCSEAERDVWAAVSAFSGGFDFDAADWVCAGVSLDEPLADVFAALVDKSVLVAQRYDMYTRFRLLPPIRYRGLRRLEETGQLGKFRRRHRDWYARLAHLAREDWISPRQVDWIHKLRRETSNLQTALGYCFDEPGEAETGLRMGVDLHEFGLAEGLFYPGLMWFHRLLPLVPESTPLRALALRTAGWWSAASGDLAGSLRLLVEGQRVADEVGGAVESLFTQTAGFVALFSGDFVRAIELFDEALDGFRNEENTLEVVQTLYLLQLAHGFVGDFGRALTCHEQCLQITEPVGESWARGYSTWIAGFTHWCRGDVPTAMTLYQRALGISHRIDDPVGIGLCFEGLAWIAAASEPERAAELLGAADGVWARIQTSTSALRGLFVHHEDAVAAISESLGEAARDDAWARGRSRSLHDAIQYSSNEKPVREDLAAVGRARGGDPQDILTTREKQVAALVAQSMSNKDIADTLVISKRTAETHVENILTKLGFTSRSQIMVWMADQVGSTTARVRRTP